MIEIDMVRYEQRLKEIKRNAKREADKRYRERHREKVLAYGAEYRAKKKST